MTRTLMTTLMLFNGCIIAGCGAPQYAKDYWKIDPSTGEMTHWSAQTVGLAIGKIHAGVNPDGTKFMDVGTTTQPAVVYGADPTSAMAQYGNQQVNYTAMLDVVGKNAIGQIEAVGDAGGKLIGGLMGLRSAAATIGGSVGTALTSSCDSAIAQVQELLAKANAAKVGLAQLQALQAAQGAK